MFSVAANITGVLTDANSITAFLHEFGKLAFWDYATAAPCTAFDMKLVPFVVQMYRKTRYTFRVTNLWVGLDRELLSLSRGSLSFARRKNWTNDAQRSAAVALDTLN